MRPLCIDLFCGLGGWADGFLSEGYDVIGFDTEMQPYPGQRVIQDVLTLHGSQFKDATCIVASPPCQAYSYRAMPWKRARALPPPDNTLFEACFRIQREACEAAGRHIPMVVENVRGAQKWVGRAKWHYGSYYLWGDVPALMPIGRPRAKNPGQDWNRSARGEKAEWWSDPKRILGRKNTGGSWFNIAHNTTSGVGNNPDGRKAPGACAPRDWKDRKELHPMFQGQNSPARKLASALIAKIPFPLARHIAWCFRPRTIQVQELGKKGA